MRTDPTPRGNQAAAWGREATAEHEYSLALAPAKRDLGVMQEVRYRSALEAVAHLHHAGPEVQSQSSGQLSRGELATQLATLREKQTHMLAALRARIAAAQPRPPQEDQQDMAAVSWKQRALAAEERLRRVTTQRAWDEASSMDGAQWTAGQTFAAAASAAEYVRIAGAVSPCADINGDYIKTEALHNHRPVYKKLGDASTILRYERGDEKSLADKWVIARNKGSVWRAWVCTPGSPDTHSSAHNNTPGQVASSAPVWCVCADSQWQEQTVVTAVAITADEQEEEEAQRLKRAEEEARCMHAAAPRFLRISGAMLGEDMPFAFVNGDYLKTADLLHQRAVYAKIGDEDKVLSYKKGKWTVGDRARPGGKQSRTRAYLSTDAAAPLTKLASGESGESGEAAQCAWQINVENKWQEQPGVVAVELTEEEVEAEQERLRAASAAAERAALDAAPYLRVSGAALADGSPNDFVNGDYDKLEMLVNGRAAYAKVGGHGVGVWYDQIGKWRIGPRCKMGSTFGKASVSSSATAPDDSSTDGAMWKVFVEDHAPGRNTSAYVLQPAVKVTILSDTERRRMQATPAVLVRISGAPRGGAGGTRGAGEAEEVGEVPGDGAGLLNGDYKRMPSLYGGCALYVKVGHSGISLWYLAASSRWILGPTEFVGSGDGAHAYLDVSKTRVSVSPAKASGVWHVRAGGRWEAEEWQAQPGMTLQPLADQLQGRMIGRRRTGAGTDASSAGAAALTPPEAEGAGEEEAGGAGPKFAATRLQLGSASESDLNASLGLDDVAVLAQCIARPLDEMADEWFQHGSDTDYANFQYVVHGRACDLDHVPAHVRESFRLGWYHGGSITQAEYDAGHAGMRLADLSAMPIATLAGLQLHHVAAIRLYTTDSYCLFNDPMRAREKPHPIKTTVLFLYEALKKLRKVAAKLNAEEYNQVLHLWRGMKNMTFDLAEFKKHGGTELAPMSTSAHKSIAMSYAASQRGLVMSFATRGLSRGVEIHEFSVYPKEREFLYPPLTYMLFDETRQVTNEDDCTVVPMTLQMS